MIQACVMLYISSDRNSKSLLSWEVQQIIPMVIVEIISKMLPVFIKDSASDQ